MNSLGPTSPFIQSLMTNRTEQTDSNTNRLYLICSILASVGYAERLCVQVVWTRKGLQMQGSDKHQMMYDEASGKVSLLIKAIGPGDEGEYTCTALNPYGEAICTVYISPEATKAVKKSRSSHKISKSKSGHDQQMVLQQQEQQQVASQQNMQKSMQQSFQQSSSSAMQRKLSICLYFYIISIRMSSLGPY